MSKPKELPPMIGEFQVVVEGDITKRRFVGDFKCKIPTMKDQCLIKKQRAQLNGDMVNFLDAKTLKIHHMVSYLKYTLVDPIPRFWLDSDGGYELMDMNVVEEIYAQVLNFENEWLKEVWGEEAFKKSTEEFLKEEKDDEKEE